MGRGKTFDPESKLDQAIEVFWNKGYYATSMDDLVTEMGVNRASLYDTYGDKRKLFLACLHRYQESMMQQSKDLAEKDTTPLVTIKNLLYWLIEMDISSGHKGCFMRNSIVELCNCDAEVDKMARETAQGVQKRMSKMIAKGQEMGEITTRSNANDLASFLYSSLNGLSITAIYQTDRKELHKIADTLVTSLSA